MSKEKVYVVRRFAKIAAVIMRKTEKRIYVAVRGPLSPPSLMYYWVTPTPERVIPRTEHMPVDDIVEKEEA